MGQAHLRGLRGREAAQGLDKGIKNAIEGTREEDDPGGGQTVLRDHTALDSAIDPVGTGVALAFQREKLRL